ncbi:hypothetical protein PTI98_013513 [Pleurotus ostreatus]|nr:hypothetical protein PTI98_013513 [Pleurotus ostreatus]
MIPIHFSSSIGTLVVSCRVPGVSLQRTLRPVSSSPFHSASRSCRVSYLVVIGTRVKLLRKYTLLPSLSPVSASHYSPCTEWPRDTSVSA